MDSRKDTELRDVRVDKRKGSKEDQRKTKYGSSRRRHFPSDSSETGGLQEGDTFQETTAEAKTEVLPDTQPVSLGQKFKERLTTRREKPNEGAGMTTNVPGSTRKTPANAMVAAKQKEVDDVAGILKDTAYKLVERGEKLENLEQKAENIAAAASSFQKTSGTLQDKMKNENKKMTKYAIIVGVVFALILIGLITYFVVK